MAGTDRSSARASAVNPSRLPARPSGLRGLTAQRAKQKSLPWAINAELRSRDAKPLEPQEKKKC